RDAARSGSAMRAPGWPAIVLRTPKGWTGPKELRHVPIEGTFRAHQVPLAGVRTDAEQLTMLEAWMKSYRPEALFDERGRLIPRLAALAPKGELRMGANPHANGGVLAKPLVVRDLATYAREVRSPGTVRGESTRALGEMLRDVYVDNPRTFRLCCP